jgi:hypothetical protein
MRIEIGSWWLHNTETTTSLPINFHM